MKHSRFKDLTGRTFDMRSFEYIGMYTVGVVALALLFQWWWTRNQ